MREIPRVTPQQIKKKVESGEVLLVCAYDSEEKFASHHLAGALSLKDFQAQEEGLPDKKEIVFYCACNQDDTAAGMAARYREKGFIETKALKGGAEAWQQAGYRTL